MISSTIYILAPHKRATGGIELIHQLCYKLRLMGFSSVIYYCVNENNLDSLTPEEYLKYNNPCTNTIINSSENYIILPEAGVYFIDFPLSSNLKKFIWWMSVDNALDLQQNLNVIPSLGIRSDILHLVQSQYAYDYLVSDLHIESANIFWLSDYINTAYLNQGPSSTRDNVVLFNPRKGFENTSRLIQKSSARIKWQALNGLTPEGMMITMHTAKVYIDFGNHPGKDRIPREAALSGLCVITNKEGSAKNDVDVPIPAEYKFENMKAYENILNKIYEIFDAFPEHQKDFLPYVEKTRSEFLNFELETYNVFSKFLDSDYKLDSSNPSDFDESILAAIDRGDINVAFSQLIQLKHLGVYLTETEIVLEVTIRKLLGEFQEAIYLANQGLLKYPDNYELYLLLIECGIAVNHPKDDILDWVKSALNLSRDTDDAVSVITYCKEVISMFS